MNNLLIVDDMITEKNLKTVTEYFIRGRKKNCSVIFITQSYYSCPKNLRSNCDIIAIMKINTKKDLGRIASEYSLGIDKKKLEKLYKHCVDSKDLNKFLLIDVGNTDARYRFRCGFSPVKLSED